MSKVAMAAALADLANEKQVAVDQALDATAGGAKGRSLIEVEALLRAELIRRGVEPGDDSASVAAQIAAAVRLRV